MAKTLEEIEAEELAEFARRVIEAFEGGPASFAEFVRTELMTRDYEAWKREERPN